MSACRKKPLRTLRSTVSRPFARSRDIGRDIFDIGIACLSVPVTPPAVTGGVTEFACHPLAEPTRAKPLSTL